MECHARRPSDVSMWILGRVLAQGYLIPAGLVVDIPVGCTGEHQQHNLGSCRWVSPGSFVIALWGSPKQGSLGNQLRVFRATSDEMGSPRLSVAEVMLTHMPSRGKYGTQHGHIKVARYCSLGSPCVHAVARVKGLFTLGSYALVHSPVNLLFSETAVSSSCAISCSVPAVVMQVSCICLNFLS